jgi:hypothetical protein
MSPDQPPGASPPSYAPPSGYTPQPAQPKNRKGVIAIAIVAVLLLCCCGTVAAGWYVFSDLLNDVEVSPGTSTTTPGAVIHSETGGPTGATTPVSVWLSWSEPVDMDLEIWDASGDSQLNSAYSLSGSDIGNGADGDEYFEFKRYGEYDDYSSGEYVVSVYFASFLADQDEARVTVTVQAADGSTETWEKTVLWDPGMDQWHAFRIDAVSGQTVEIDQFK